VALKKIAEKPWMYTLYEVDQHLLLTVVCGDVGIYELNIPLGPEDSARVIHDHDYLEQLAVEIMNNPSKYASQSVPLG
jgi:hypothetical protein